ncbi:3-hydroxybutyryl-CoA dehydrogenase [Caldibacillus thermoamylovorans]|jgi:3-hydroxybutyryl-CoA dehydrogenase|uniref:3-hydroxybutyryl-CoA dehydrogenase n=1 Tax=Caldibacillus thermoamylovorans TaxID=35841 RepID=A0A090IXL8_9BACI|nr:MULTISPECIES: 3-hydroxyacyl-CoA dehydrogenase [Bacillaceae]KIO66120.1 3-hydroxybutyryl-CoA dehydrogenase [Caldibacillus thermoamylovorans]KIO72545.1 3-hydroxybutyryl-CoA dehydrogenase [Caldibacillus thermoamylovorans]MCM3056344.1 3-hydroxyacyl-CoA dehydrogenase [Caldibacillus thermoamylovorans]PAC34474.1 3-hydroxybutyryl-CoA dehydrogenase [Caldifermentibacillus hisashii]CEE02442.1 3-hydroxybutyryl-CoA dehydrogenase [Caldibacillus thermoamylovorans]
MERVTVVGAGVMGKGIAYAFAISNFQVVLNDIRLEALQKAEADINQLLNDSFQKGFLSEVQYARAKENLQYDMELASAVKDADLVVEAVIERMDIKADVFQKLDKLCKSDAVLATNTSTMSPTEIGAQTSRPDKVVAMHFFNPVHKMKLIEIVRGLETSDETVQFAKEVATKLKKEYVEVNEFPGFVTSRMNCLVGNEAMNMLMEGVASAKDIDKAIKLGLNHPMGPLELADLVGLDTRLRNMEYLYQTLGEKYRPSPILVKYVKAGRLGRKSGRGFYEYN